MVQHYVIFNLIIYFKILNFIIIAKRKYKTIKNSTKYYITHSKNLQLCLWSIGCQSYTTIFANVFNTVILFLINAVGTISNTTHTFCPIHKINGKILLLCWLLC